LLEISGIRDLREPIAWIDPEHDLVYVFLSDRVYPTRNDREMGDADIRTGIDEVIYQAIKTGN
jgi:CubicO group peptidase (beta-lactamase class C family)